MTLLISDRKAFNGNCARLFRDSNSTLTTDNDQYYPRSNYQAVTTRHLGDDSDLEHDYHINMQEQNKNNMQKLLKSHTRPVTFTKAQQMRRSIPSDRFSISIVCCHNRDFRWFVPLVAPNVPKGQQSHLLGEIPSPFVTAVGRHALHPGRVLCRIKSSPPFIVILHRGLSSCGVQNLRWIGFKLICSSLSSYTFHPHIRRVVS
ncbi:unnamed protein product [Nezara viridula]|uniref:Uncharacterized protein n=1 Tax=Nezara viridula TaxID=85310 RepID=A0A9P0ECG2_NEZVI|nr:unnamed protein product [Nezara viridula]